MSRAAAVAAAALAAGWGFGQSRQGFVRDWLAGYPKTQSGLAPGADAAFGAALARAADAQTLERVVYDPAYVRIPYPGGDVPAGTGVCTDVLIRAYRKVGLDLQLLVHEDMAAHFALYPRLWGRRQPDSNIDHRRVPNLLVFLRRHGLSLPLLGRPESYLPGDVVAYDLGGGVTHIGLVSERRGGAGRRLLVHNIGRGPEQEDVLFSWTMIGHFRYAGPR